MVDPDGQRSRGSTTTSLHRRSSSTSAGSYEQAHPHKDVQCWTSMRAIFGMMIPSCCSAGSNSSSTSAIACNTNGKLGLTTSPVGQSGLPITSVVTCTIFGARKGRVNFCVQEDPSSPPLLLLEFAIPTHLLVKEMQSGLLRITLECEKKVDSDHYILEYHGRAAPLFSEPVWSMYCNGRKVGFALKRTAKSESDSCLANLMCMMQSVTTGAGVIPCRSMKASKHDIVTSINNNAASKSMSRTISASSGINHDIAAVAKGGALNTSKDCPTKTDGGMYINTTEDSLICANATVDYDCSMHMMKLDDDTNLGLYDSLLEDGRLVGAGGKLSSINNIEEDELIYMRATYERVVGSPDSEAFHMINPDGSQCQELSIFLTRS